MGGECVRSTSLGGLHEVPYPDTPTAGSKVAFTTMLSEEVQMLVKRNALVFTARFAMSFLTEQRKKCPRDQSHRKAFYFFRVQLS